MVVNDPGYFRGAAKMLTPSWSLSLVLNTSPREKFLIFFLCYVDSAWPILRPTSFINRPGGSAAKAGTDMSGLWNLASWRWHLGCCMRRIAPMCLVGSFPHTSRYLSRRTCTQTSAPSTGMRSYLALTSTSSAGTESAHTWLQCRPASQTIFNSLGQYWDQQAAKNHPGGSFPHTSMFSFEQ